MADSINFTVLSAGLFFLSTKIVVFVQSVREVTSGSGELFQGLFLNILG